MDEHTPTPWNWVIHDHSMASLGHGDSPGIGDPLVLAISPCPSCADRADPKEWKWGRCHTPSEADAEFILTAINSYDEMQEVLADLWLHFRATKDPALKGIVDHARQLLPDFDTGDDVSGVKAS